MIVTIITVRLNYANVNKFNKNRKCLLIFKLFGRQSERGRVVEERTYQVVISYN